MRAIALFGPSAVGKTAVAIALAELLEASGERPLAVSADALQVYRGLEALTGVPSAAQRRRLEHRLVSFVPVTETFSAGAYAGLAHTEIDAAIGDGRRPIVVGGTGLYMQAALTDLELRPAPGPQLRGRLEARLRALGSEALHAELAARDAAVAASIPARDRVRVVRALELLEMGEEPAPTGERSRLWTARMRRPTLLCGLVMERGELYERIDARVDAIVAGGAPREVRRADAAGASRTARAALGFEELLRGDIAGMRRRTRSYAKRQLTWLRRLDDVHRIDLTQREPAAAAAEIHALLGLDRDRVERPVRSTSGSTRRPA